MNIVENSVEPWPKKIVELGAQRMSETAEKEMILVMLTISWTANRGPAEIVRCRFRRRLI